MKHVKWWNGSTLLVAAFGAGCQQVFATLSPMSRALITINATHYTEE